MLKDLVLDANVLVHADNAQEESQSSCQELLRLLRDRTTRLCVDEGFDLNEAKNRSHIGSEYLKHLKLGMLGYAIVSHLAQSARIRVLPRSVSQAVSKQIRRQISKGPDRTYVQVAFNSEEKTLTSHDFGDIPQTVRNRLRASINVTVLAAKETILLFNGVAG